MAEIKIDLQEVIDKSCLTQLGITWERLLELCQAELENRCVVLPCKAGNVVYEANIARNIVSTYKVTSVVIMTNSRNYGWELLDGIYSNVNGFNEFALGKTVFLAHEEAENALKGEWHE